MATKKAKVSSDATITINWEIGGNSGEFIITAENAAKNIRPGLHNQALFIKALGSGLKQTFGGKVKIE